MVRPLLRRIVDSVASGSKCHLRLVFSDNDTYDTMRVGEPNVTIIFRNRAAEWRQNNNDIAQAKRNAAFYGRNLLLLGTTD
jgi:hypothetical protein